MRELEGQGFGVKPTPSESCLSTPASPLGPQTGHSVRLSPSLLLINWGLSTYPRGLLRGLSNNSQLLFSVYCAPGTILSVLRASPTSFNHHDKYRRGVPSVSSLAHEELGTGEHKYPRVTPFSGGAGTP